MYDGLFDLKQFLISYEATISSHCGNSVVMAKSFVMARDGFGSDTHGNGFECHYLLYFNPNTDTNTIGYEYKTDSSNSDLHSDIYLIWNIAS
jgi:hypothetical protein